MGPRWRHTPKRSWLTSCSPNPNRKMNRTGLDIPKCGLRFTWPIFAACLCWPCTLEITPPCQWAVPFCVTVIFMTSPGCDTDSRMSTSAGPGRGGSQKTASVPRGSHETSAEVSQTGQLEKWCKQRLLLMIMTVEEAEHRGESWRNFWEGQPMASFRVFTIGRP